MRATVRVVCRRGLVPGFALAGVPADPLDPGDAIEPLLAEYARHPEVGVVLVQEEIYDALSDEVRARLDRAVMPVVVPFPGPSWERVASAEARVIELLRRAIGYRVKLT